MPKVCLTVRDMTCGDKKKPHHLSVVHRVCSPASARWGSRGVPWTHTWRHWRIVACNSEQIRHRSAIKFFTQKLQNSTLFRRSLLVIYILHRIHRTLCTVVKTRFIIHTWCRPEQAVMRRWVALTSYPLPLSSDQCSSQCAQSYDKAQWQYCVEHYTSAEV